MIRLRPLSSWRASVSTVASSSPPAPCFAAPGFLGQPLWDSIPPRRRGRIATSVSSQL